MNVVRDGWAFFLISFSFRELGIAAVAVCNKDLVYGYKYIYKYIYIYAEYISYFDCTHNYIYSPLPRCVPIGSLRKCDAVVATNNIIHVLYSTSIDRNKNVATEEGRSSRLHT